MGNVHGHGEHMVVVIRTEGIAWMKLNRVKSIFGNGSINACRSAAPPSLPCVTLSEYINTTPVTPKLAVIRLYLITPNTP